MVDHCDVDDECLRALISSIVDIDEWGLLDYEINVGGEYNERALEHIIESLSLCSSMIGFDAISLYSIATLLTYQSLLHTNRLRIAF